MWEQVISYLRGPFLFIFNFHPSNSYEQYNVGVEEAGAYQVKILSFLSCLLLIFLFHYCDQYDFFDIGYPEYG